MLHLPRRRRIRHAALIVAMLLVAGLAVAAPVAARTIVDPSTLNPPIPPTSNPVCGWSGDQVICSSDRTFSVVDSETGIVCDGNEVLESSDRHVFGQRLYNANLDLVEIRFVEEIDGSLFVPGGASIHWTGTDRGVQQLSVPGDRSTGVLVNSGAGIHLYPAGGGSIALSGRTTESFDTGDFFSVGNDPDFSFCALLD
jgi:hypothetical protein